MLGDFSYTLLTSRFGTIGLVWKDTETGPKVHRVLLPPKGVIAEDLVSTAYGAARHQSCPTILRLGEQIQQFLQGEPVRFNLDSAALDRCSEFQQRVLLAEYDIPRGWVSSYGRIAKHLGVPGGSRAVGGALARNPFPIIIPCHRAIKSDGGIGGFQGGVEMKRALLEMEGVNVSETGKVFAQGMYF